MSAQSFKDLYMAKLLPSIRGTELAAIVNVPKEDGTPGNLIEVDVPGIPDDERLTTVGIFGNQPNPVAEKYGLPPFMRVESPQRSGGSSTNPYIPGGIPAVGGFNREATLEYFPNEMKGIPEGFMPGKRRNRLPDGSHGNRQL